MNPLTQERIEKAEADFRTAVRELAAADQQTASVALEDCKIILAALRQSFGLA